MSNVPRTIRSLILWGRSFPERQPSFNVAFIAIRNHFQQEQLMANSFHVIFAFITPLVLNLLGLRYHGNPITPFDTQPITMMVGISCLLAYCLAYGFEMKCHVSRLSPTHQPTLLRRSMVLFGSLSLASFVSILFPDSVQLTLLGLYALLVMGLQLHAQVRIFWNWIVQRIIPKFFRARATSMRQRSNTAHWLVAATTNRNQGNLLPL